MVNIRKLESDLWESADLLRAGSKLTSNQYCMPVLGLIFLRYAYSRFKLVEKEILKNRPVRGGRVLPVEASDFVSKSALFLPREAQYEYLVNLPADIASAGLTNQGGHTMNSLGEVVNNAMELVEAQSEQLVGVLPKDYTIFSDELLAELLRIFNNNALDEVGGDVIGRIYEYFLNKFAKNIAQDDGVFFTPKSLVKMIVNVLEPQGGVLLDPACGSGGMFVQTGDFVNAAGMEANSAMTFYGQEKVEYNAQLCLMNMAVHGLNGLIKSGDEANTFYHDAHNLDGCCDYVMANPPFNVDKVNSESAQSAGRLPFGLPSVNKAKEVGNANYLWISYFYSYLNERGRAGFVMASSATDSSGKDKDIRQRLVESGHVDVMVSVGNNFFYTKSLPCSLWFFDKGKPEALRDKVLFIDARNYYTVVDRTLNEWSEWQLKNLNAIVWLYRNQTAKYAMLIDHYEHSLNSCALKLQESELLFVIRFLLDETHWSEVSIENRSTLIPLCNSIEKELPQIHWYNLVENQAQVKYLEQLKQTIEKFKPLAIEALKSVFDNFFLFSSSNDVYEVPKLKKNASVASKKRAMSKKPGGRTEKKYAAVIDFQNPENNRFLAVQELKVDGDLYHKRPDIVGFVNGIPLLFVELKAPRVDVQDAYTNNYTDYLDTIPHLFYYNAFLILSNGLESKVGTLGSKYEFFHEWKRLEEKEQGSVALETMLRGICKKENFLDLLENFILFDHSGGHTAKILARNHQYLGVNEAVKAYEARRLNNGKLGVFWHTQGSGKSYSMVFLAQKIRRKFSGSPTIVVLTDREELNRQISDTFENCGILGKAKAGQFIASSGTDLVEKLRGNPSFIFTLIQKFNKTDVEPISPDHDILIMSDEAHRSQYGIFADNMVRLLPTASRIGFTGTPLLSSDRITERTFGGYISVYDFQRAVDDGATVPLYYENRGEKILDVKDNPEITDRILDAIEQADLDVNQQDKLEQEFAKEIHLLTATPRLERIAQDFARHYSDLWTSGKAMFVCLNKVTCVRMYDLVQKYWADEIDTLKERIKSASQQEAQELERKLQWMQETEMAVVISQEQNEVQSFQKWGLDIQSHRAKMEKRELDKEFKDADNPLRVVFVCAMWLTGFDVKCLSCLYLDKPLKAHTLMQTIARANRVAEGKNNGLIIDYIGIVKALRKALADYTANGNGTGGADPTVDKEQLIARILELIASAESFLTERDFTLQALIDARGFEKLALLQTAANTVSATLEKKKTFQTYASELARLVKYMNREDVETDTRQKYEAITAIHRLLNRKRRTADNVDLMVEINRIISEYVQIEQAAEGITPSRQFDISKIDFDLLRREFAHAKKKNLILKDLQGLVCERLDRMLLSNPNRIQYHERYQAIIEDYNSQQDRANIEKTFDELMKLVQSMDQEEQRYVREGFSSDEELSLYDMLFSENLSKQDIQKIKQVAVDLLQKVKSRIAELDHWTDKQETKAAIDNLIRDTLWNGLPECYDELSISGYRQRIYEYVYTRYKDVA